MMRIPITPSTLPSPFVRLWLVVLSFVLGALTGVAGDEPANDAQPATAVSSAHQVTVAVTSLLGEFADDAAAVPGWVISFAGGHTSGRALGAGALPVPFDPLQPMFSEQPPVNFSGVTTGATTTGGAIAASMAVAGPPTNQHAARLAPASGGHPIRVATRPEVRPG
jgi:hypothetical protein